MSSSHQHAEQAQPRAAVASAAPRPAAPAAPVPLAAAGRLVVGHAEDRAETDADRVADSALSRLRGADADAHVHGPGCEHLRRQVAPSAGPLRRTEVPEAPPRTGAAAAPYVRGPARSVGDIPDRANLTGAADQLTSFNSAPTTLDELVACSDKHVARMVHDTRFDGPLRDVLLGAFEADWFRAKSCLVFGKWPQGKTPAWHERLSLQLMSALTVYRGAVHQAVKPLAQAGVNRQLKERAAQLKGNTKLGDRLTMQRGLPGKDQVDYKGSVGADTVTSDVDVSTGGVNSELAVRAYNEAFRKLLDVPFDPGTVFDLNVYAMDFIHGKTDSEDKKSFTTKSENPEQPDAADAAARDREQDIWALVHVARYMPDDADWDGYVLQTIAGIRDPKQQAEQQARLATARSRAKGFEERLVGMMVHLEKDLHLTEKQLEQSAWDQQENQHYLQGALRMRAANKLYEDKLLQVKDMRLQIAELRNAVAQGKQGADPEQLKLLVSRLSGELSMAQLYANEVYGSGGATVHAVMGMQTKKKLSTERGFDVKAIIPVQEWYQAFTDNLGDVLKDYEHYGKGHGEHGVDHWYAAFKMGKYADRMVDAIPHLTEGGLITQAHGAKLLVDADVETLRTLAAHHVAEKNGPAKDDPARLKEHHYFKTMDAGSLDDLRQAALDVGAKVRQLVAAAETAPIVDPSTAPAPEAPATAPGSTSGKSAQSLALAAQAARAQDLLEEIEDEAEDFE
ncbi:hypothetical protein [Nocardioides sp. W7]|uniref:hypothetical protein n=1 Tax=Nocardioides sp. W7 TaxID=2931390 RepID=UPI001FD2B9FE|nr:hypothetical protein [Nocardioides sp. W7]